ncbi:cwf21, partial [Symbiodinium sp. KB8]
MYNGIGLRTARGSGTNGYVTKNFGYVRPDIVRAKTTQADRDHERLRTRAHDPKILEHELRRQVKVKVMELREAMERKG